MGVGLNSYYSCLDIRAVLEDTYKLLSSTPACLNSTKAFKYELIYKQDDICSLIHSKAEGESYSKPMLWIGIYIAVASLLCILAMAADLFHGFRNKKLWFPSKYFTLNVASIMVITTAMKLPVDLNDPMPGWTDQFAKIGSMPFMSTMMANLMPSMAAMDNQELLENLIGLLILVITVVVNILIQIETGVLDRIFNTYIFIAAMLYLLIVSVSLALTTPASKHILECKYQAAHEMASKDLVNKRMFTVEELLQRVRRYWIMAGTCSPQFVMATTPLCSAAGIISICSAVVYFYYVVMFFTGGSYVIFIDYDSDYKWSMLAIFVTQTIGVLVGAIAPIFRCFAALSFKLSLKWCKKHTRIFEVEGYWVQKLLEWKEIDLVLSLKNHTMKVLIHHLTKLVVNISIGFQKVIVVLCKTIALIPIGFVIIGVYCVHCWKLVEAMFFSMPILSKSDVIHKLEHNNMDQDVGKFVLQLDNEMELGSRTLKSISNLVERIIQKAEKHLPKNVLELVEQSSGFEGVASFDSDKVPPLVPVELPNSWSLPIVTLTCLAKALPSVCVDSVDSLSNSVRESLSSYIFLVEESLNNDVEAQKIQKASKILWHEVDITSNWLGYPLQANGFNEKAPIEVLKWFSEKAEEMVIDFSNNEEMLENSRDKMIAANSMYRITQTIMLDYHDNISHGQLFALLSNMIANIVVACLTNLPQVIAMKCHENNIEKREMSVRTAAKLLGSTKKIIERLHERTIPSLDPDQMPFIDEWRVYLRQSIP